MLDGDDAMEKARSKASELITKAAHEAMKDITDRVDLDDVCKIGERAQMKVWQRWHMEWKCHKAQL